MHPHISNINIFDANKVVVTESDTTTEGGSHSVKVEIFGDDDIATTIITIWRESGNASEAPHLGITPAKRTTLGELLGDHSEGDSDP